MRVRCCMGRSWHGAALWDVFDFWWERLGDFGRHVGGLLRNAPPELRRAPVTLTRYPNLQQCSISTLPFPSASNFSLAVAINIAYRETHNITRGGRKWGSGQAGFDRLMSTSRNFPKYLHEYILSRALILLCPNSQYSTPSHFNITSAYYNPLRHGKH